MDATQTSVVRALVVDDNADVLSLVKRLIERLNCQATACTDPAKSIDVAKSIKPHLILLDLAMPGMDGLQVAEALKAARLPSFLLAAVTGYDTKDLRARCSLAGFDRFVAKPVSLEKLEELVAEARGLVATPAVGSAKTTF